MPTEITHVAPKPYYELTQVKGQLILEHKGIETEPQDSEVFMKKVPRDVTIQEIYDFASSCGYVYKVRLLMDFSGFNRGYCFVDYFQMMEARRAVIFLDDKEIRQNWPVKVKLSFDNNKLFLQGIPDQYSIQQVSENVKKVIGKGFKSVTKAVSRTQGKINYLIHYRSHRFALEARKSVWPAISLFEDKFDIEWAIPENIRHSTKLYFVDVPDNCTKEKLFEFVTPFINISKLLSVFLDKGTGYISFKDKQSAMETLNHLLATDKRLGDEKWSLEKVDEVYVDYSDSTEDGPIDHDILMKSAKIFFQSSGPINKHHLFNVLANYVNTDDIITIKMDPNKRQGCLLFKDVFSGKEAYISLSDKVFKTLIVDQEAVTFDLRDFGSFPDQVAEVPPPVENQEFLNDDLLHDLNRPKYEFLDYWSTNSSTVTEKNVTVTNLSATKVVGYINLEELIHLKPKSEIISYASYHIINSFDYNHYLYNYTLNNARPIIGRSVICPKPVKIVEIEQPYFHTVTPNPGLYTGSPSQDLDPVFSTNPIKEEFQPSDDEREKAIDFAVDCLVPLLKALDFGQDSSKISSTDLDLMKTFQDTIDTGLIDKADSSNNSGSANEVSSSSVSDEVDTLVGVTLTDISDPGRQESDNSWAYNGTEPRNFHADYWTNMPIFARDNYVFGNGIWACNSSDLYK